MHTQMYMLEGSSRWNMNRAHEAVGMSGASQTKLYNIRLMSNLNDLSNKVLGNALLPEFIPPGRPTGKILQETSFSLKPQLYYYTFNKLSYCFFPHSNGNMSITLN